jgi:hypothetical protein
MIEVSKIIRNCANDKIDNAFHRLGFEAFTFDATGDEGNFFYICKDTVLNIFYFLL